MIDVFFVEPVVGDRAIGARIAEDVERAGGAAADANVRRAMRSGRRRSTTSVSATSPGSPVSLTSALNACENGSRSCRAVEALELSNRDESLSPVNVVSFPDDLERLGRKSAASSRRRRRSRRSASGSSTRARWPSCRAASRTRETRRASDRCPAELSTVRIDRNRREPAAARPLSVQS